MNPKMNTKLYKKVHTLAIEMLKAAEEGNDSTFNNYYDELKALCDDNQSTEKNHPVQWETLADFTEDIDEALLIYQQALVYAEGIQSRDFMASINYAMAVLYKEQGEAELALQRAQQASDSAGRIEDQELQREIRAILKVLR